MNYAVLTDESESMDDGYGGTYTKRFTQFREFDSKESMIDWLEENDLKSYNQLRVTKIIEFNELKLKRTLALC